MTTFGGHKRIKRVKKRRAAARWTVTFCMALAIPLATAGCSFFAHFSQEDAVRGQTPTANPGTGGESQKTVYVVSNGWHAGLVLHVAEIDPDVLPELKPLSHRRFLEVGWGDEGFYRATTLSLNVAARAIFLPTPSVLHLVGFDHRPDRIYGNSDIVELKISDEHHRRLCRFIHNSFDLDDGGRPKWVGPGIYGESHFFRARGSYFYPKTCNVWTAAALKVAGLPMVPALSTTAGSVVLQARPHGRTLNSASPLATIRVLAGPRSERAAQTAIPPTD